MNVEAMMPLTGSLMDKWKYQSEVAAKECVCHTHAECELMYQDIPQEKRDKAVLFLIGHMDATGDRKILQEMKQKYGRNWRDYITSLFWGMEVRNVLRQNGFGEDYFEVHNLDCIYLQLVEDAI